MKNIFKSLAVLSLALFGLNTASAQVQSNGTVGNNITGENPFFDASTNFDTASNGTPNNIGKGLYFPTTNLVQWTFKTTNMDGVTFPTAFDGMIVYNSGSGNTIAGQGVVTAVAPGFYYFSNPGQSTSITNGRWMPLGGDPKFNVTTAETTTNTLVNGGQVFAKKGRFVASGTSTAPTSYPDGAISVPASGTAGIYRVTVFKAGTGSVFANGVYSYDISNGNLITGSPSMSVVYPAGTYDYVVEYTK